MPTRREKPWTEEQIPAIVIVTAHPREGTRGVRAHVRHEMARGLLERARQSDLAAHEDSVQGQRFADAEQPANALPHFMSAQSKIIAARNLRMRAYLLRD